MSNFLDKSNQNKNIAFYLYTNAPIPCYAASVHCSYYSCLQKLLHILKYEYSSYYDKVQEEGKGKKKGNLHRDYFWIIGEIIQKHGMKADFERKRANRDLKSHLKQLKHLRIEADYYDVEIQKDKAEKAYEYAQKVHRLIKKHLNQ